MKRWLFNVAAALGVAVDRGRHGMGDELRADNSLAPGRERTLCGPDGIGPQAGNSALHDHGELVKGPNHGFWDAWWALSQSGRLTLLAQVIDYDGTLRLVYASPPSMVVDLASPGNRQAVVFGRMPDAGRVHWDSTFNPTNSKSMLSDCARGR